MKIIIIFLLAGCIAFAQTREPEQALIHLNGDSVLLNSEIDYFKLDEFMFGWQLYQDYLKKSIFSHNKYQVYVLY